MKYVILEDKRSGYSVPVVFDESLVHKEMVRGLGKTHRLISAGFCHFKQDKGWVVEGGRKSDSLNIGPHRQDQTILTLFLDRGLSGLDLQNLLMAFVFVKTPEDAKKLMQSITPHGPQRPTG
jgi:hypothetical protein